LSQPLEPRPTNYPEKLIKLDNVRAVLFDIYGTLFISGSGDISLGQNVDNSAALSSALAACGVTGDLTGMGKSGIERLRSEIKLEHARLKQEGVDFPEVDIREIWARALSGFPATQKFDQAMLERLAIEYECRVNPVWPMPGAEELLAEMRERKIPLGIVSNAQFCTPLLFQALLGKTLEETGFTPELCVWSYHLRRAKPSAQMFGNIIKRLRAQNISQEQIVYIGNDCLNDIYTAKMAGCRAVLFAGDARSLRLRPGDARCGNCLPDAVITDLRQLSGLLET